LPKAEDASWAAKRLKEFLATLEHGDLDALTTTELCDLSGLSLPTVKKVLRKMMQSGEVTPTRKSVVALDGRRVMVSAYKFRREGK